MSAAGRLLTRRAPGRVNRRIVLIQPVFESLDVIGPELLLADAALGSYAASIGSFVSARVAEPSGVAGQHATSKAALTCSGSRTPCQSHRPLEDPPCERSTKMETILLAASVAPDWPGLGAQEITRVRDPSLPRTIEQFYLRSRHLGICCCSVIARCAIASSCSRRHQPFG